MCAGGPPALCAIARPPSRARRRPDFLLLVQERSGRVLNAARRLAVIPKSFHGSLVDYAEDAQIHLTLEREMEEELFGREDVDSVLGDQRRADPMHRSRLSAPMRWLMDHLDDGAWRAECTGFGFNLLTGNYEFASLVVVHDDAWWDEYGGHIEANWESAGLRRYSALDRDAVTALILDPGMEQRRVCALPARTTPPRRNRRATAPTYPPSTGRPDRGRQLVPGQRRHRRRPIPRLAPG